VSFSLATTESWRDKATGERKDRTEWHNISIFNENLGKVAEQYLKKGAKVYIEGQLQTREFTDKEGHQRKATDIVLTRFRGELVLLDGRGARGDESAFGGGASSGGGSFGRQSPLERGPSERGGAGGGAGGGGRASDTIDDDIPF
jgi:single-strand DNA-binding protein